MTVNRDVSSPWLVAVRELVSRINTRASRNEFLGGRKSISRARPFGVTELAAGGRPPLRTYGIEKGAWWPGADEHARRRTFRVNRYGDFAFTVPLLAYTELFVIHRVHRSRGI